MCHMILLNVEFSNAYRFRIFQCHFSTVSRFPFPRFQVIPVLTRTNRVLEVARILTKHSKCCDKSSCWQCLCTLLFRYFICRNYSTRCWKLSLYHIRFINQISKEVPYQTFSISFHFHKIVHENTFSLTPPCFIWVSRAVEKYAGIVLTAFCQCSSFVVNGTTEI